jgi:nucleotide-binding universal stress UspA family protein
LVAFLMADKPILIAFDGSEPARHAIARAAELYPGRQALVLTVWQRVAAQAGYGARLAGYRAAARVLDESNDQWARETAEEGAEVAREAGLVARALAAESSSDAVWQAIIEVADAHDACCIVLGSRGLSKARAWLLGSISHAVAQESKRPVTIVK